MDDSTVQEVEEDKSKDEEQQQSSCEIMEEEKEDVKVVDDADDDSKTRTQPTAFSSSSSSSPYSSSSTSSPFGISSFLAPPLARDQSSQQSPSASPVVLVVADVEWCVGKFEWFREHFSKFRSTWLGKQVEEWDWGERRKGRGERQEMRSIERSRELFRLLHPPGSPFPSNSLHFAPLISPLHSPLSFPFPPLGSVCLFLVSVPCFQVISVFFLFAPASTLCSATVFFSLSCFFFLFVL